MGDFREDICKCYNIISAVQEFHRYTKVRIKIGNKVKNGFVIDKGLKQGYSVLFCLKYIVCTEEKM